MSCPICYREKCVVEHGAVAARNQLGSQWANDCQQQQAHQGQVVSALTAVPAEPGMTKQAFDLAVEAYEARCTMYREIISAKEAETQRLMAPTLPGVPADVYTANLRTSLERAVAELSDRTVENTELLAENARLRRMVEKKR